MGDLGKLNVASQYHRDSSFSVQLLNIVTYFQMHHMLFNSYLVPVMKHPQLENRKRTWRLLVSVEMNSQASCFSAATTDLGDLS